MSKNSQDQTEATRRRKTKKGTWRTVAATLILSLLWGGTVYAAYTIVDRKITNNYNRTQAEVSQAIKSVQETNALNIKQLEDKLSRMTAAMEEIGEALDDADDTLTQSNSSREELNKRIEDLDNQLEQLEESLEILKGNGNAKD
ncbi:hypothetical protein MFMK1_003180 [Metallumcola ferriviriculae]|uniref:Uncharacterized protein n=1 Tax=Metallumcola ferriviriculae TaxID=3039180 RepID=A0AAU0UVI6_9FIRM|nr:hypothetical protein MFMK1_003180 [Desulfitibacteraceae bacterium MK1]